MSPPFDRADRLEDLLPAATLAVLGPALQQLLGTVVTIGNRDGVPLWGPAAEPATESLALVAELEPIGYLSAAAPPACLAAARDLLQQLLRAQMRYRMAADLHSESVAADYEALVRKHQALELSEARYKALSAELEQRVAQQMALLEERRLQLYQAEKLASVGQLAAGVAHEINNPIGFVRSNLTTLRGYLQQLALLKPQLDEATRKALDLDYLLDDGAELLDDCIVGIDRVGAIVRDLKGFSNVDGAEQEIADVNEKLRLACAVIAGRKPDGVTLSLDLEPLPPLLCMPAHLNQVFFNILQNALQAVGEAGEIKVVSRAQADGIHVEIADNGVGIAAEHLPRVFEPFFTTREVGAGIGLGLTVARDVIGAHQGTIAVASEPGRGTRVSLFIPL